MNVREKLIDLIIDAKRTDPETDSFTEYLADHLIARGVTVQEWISVGERLPEPYVPVLIHMPGEKPFQPVREGFLTGTGVWHSALFDRRPDEVTHWMPLPEPPKGE